jgi:hypothetical protein
LAVALVMEYVPAFPCMIIPETVAFPPACPGLAKAPPMFSVIPVEAAIAASMVMLVVLARAVT